MARAGGPPRRPGRSPRPPGRAGARRPRRTGRHRRGGSSCETRTDAADGLGGDARHRVLALRHGDDRRAGTLAPDRHRAARERQVGPRVGDDRRPAPASRAHRRGPGRGRRPGSATTRPAGGRAATHAAAGPVAGAFAFAFATATNRSLGRDSPASASIAQRPVPLSSTGGRLISASAARRRVAAFGPGTADGVEELRRRADRPRLGLGARPRPSGATAEGGLDDAGGGHRAAGRGRPRRLPGHRAGHLLGVVRLDGHRCIGHRLRVRLPRQRGGHLLRVGRDDRRLGDGDDGLRDDGRGLGRDPIRDEGDRGGLGRRGDRPVRALAGADQAGGALDGAEAEGPRGVLARRAWRRGRPRPRRGRRWATSPILGRGRGVGPRVEVPDARRRGRRGRHLGGFEEGADAPVEVAQAPPVEVRGRGRGRRDEGGGDVADGGDDRVFQADGGRRPENRKAGPSPARRLTCESHSCAGAGVRAPQIDGGLAGGEGAVPGDDLHRPLPGDPRQAGPEGASVEGRQPGPRRPPRRGGRARAGGRRPRGPSSHRDDGSAAADRQIGVQARIAADPPRRVHDELQALDRPTRPPPGRGSATFPRPLAKTGRAFGPAFSVRSPRNGREVGREVYGPSSISRRVEPFGSDSDQRREVVARLDGDLARGGRGRGRRRSSAPRLRLDDRGRCAGRPARLWARRRGRSAGPRRPEGRPPGRAPAPTRRGRRRPAARPRRAGPRRDAAPRRRGAGRCPRQAIGAEGRNPIAPATLSRSRESWSGDW